MYAWDQVILIPTGTWGCEALNTVLWCGVCGKKVEQVSYIGVLTAMRRQQFLVLRLVHPSACDETEKLCYRLMVVKYFMFFSSCLRQVIFVCRLSSGVAFLQVMEYCSTLVRCSHHLSNLLLHWGWRGSWVACRYSSYLTFPLSVVFLPFCNFWFLRTM